MILTINSGSTSVKLAAFETDGALQRLRSEQHGGTNLDAAQLLSEFIGGLPHPVATVTHRVVHGGTRFTRPTAIDAPMLRALEELAPLAPLHNPPAMRWIAAAQQICPDARHIAVFDTGYFAQLPPVAARYAIPDSIGASLGVRRYGFHGIAHEAMWRRWCELTPELPEGGRLISLQLGGGCSIAAIARGRPLDISMGFSPLEGLVMATRAGDIDAAIVPYLERRLNVPAADIVSRLNHESGLLGLSGTTGDMNALLADSSAHARFAVEFYCYRASKYLGAFCAVLGGCDGIVFGGGVGEHAPRVRESILSNLRWAGIELDSDANRLATGGEARLHTEASAAGIYALRVDEETSLARAALA